MDRFLTQQAPADQCPGKGSARRALPFLLRLAVAAALAALVPARGRALDVVEQDQPSLDAGARLIDGKAAVLDNLAAAVGFPSTGNSWLLAGGGATITPGPVRAQVSAWEGSLSANAGGRSTGWNLGLAALTIEQSYPMGAFLVTAGTSIEAAQLEGSFIEAGQLTGVQAPLFGTSIQAGVRWPAHTKLGFFLRGGWEWLSGGGTWHGPLAPILGSTQFELGGPTATLQAELSF